MATDGIKTICLILIAGSFASFDGALAGPLPATAQSIERGRTLFQRHCTQCHGNDGKAQVDVIADAIDLTSPEGYLSGTGAEDIYRSIHDGAGVAHPQFGMEIRDEDIWHLVNFVRSLWPEEQRPAVQP